ncbi:hydantoinase/oxoprolinase family protein, partial [Clavibacter michiganensis]|uniref:hydantoinase/oxoprolinase family protein n=1 Tax=Clavibacter michiganensis TaxID=28447 RepID=UPI00292F0159
MTRTRTRTRTAAWAAVIAVALAASVVLSLAVGANGLHPGLLLDIGGTTSDVGVLAGGFPREATAEISVAGVRTN